MFLYANAVVCWVSRARVPSLEALWGNVECNEEASNPTQKGTKAPELLGKVDIRKADLTSAGGRTDGEVEIV